MKIAFEQLIYDHSHVTTVVVDLLNSYLLKTKTPLQWNELIKPLTWRILSSASSLENLLSTDTIQGQYTTEPLRFFDISSTYTLCRTIIESYLTFYYLYIDPKTNNERNLKYKLFYVHGLTTKHKLAPPPNEHNELISANSRFKIFIENFNREKQLILSYWTEIENDPLLHHLYPEARIRKMLLNREQPRAKTKNWLDIIKASTLPTNSFSNKWQMYSNHAHAEYWSLDQVKAIFDNKEQDINILKELLIKDSLMILSVLIFELVDYLDLQKEYNNTNKQLQDCIRFWQRFAMSLD